MITVNDQTFQTHADWRDFLLATRPAVVTAPSWRGPALRYYLEPATNLWRLSVHNSPGFLEFENGLKLLMNQIIVLQLVPPDINDLATLVLPQDSYPYVVVATSGRVVTLKAIRLVDTTTGHQPAKMVGGFPIWDHVYTAEEAKALETNKVERAVRGNNGEYAIDGAAVYFGTGHYYRDFRN